MLLTGVARQRGAWQVSCLGIFNTGAMLSIDKARAFSFAGM